MIFNIVVTSVFIHRQIKQMIKCLNLEHILPEDLLILLPVFLGHNLTKLWEINHMRIRKKRRKKPKKDPLILLKNPIGSID